MAGKPGVPDTAVQSLPLFPLHTVVFPSGRIPLQIFEPRYVQLMKRCIRDQALFGVVRIEQGSEVRQAADAGMPAIANIGTTVRLVDWFSLEHGMLGVVIEGQQRFEVMRSWLLEDGLVMAEVTMLQDPVAVLADAERESLASLWQDLRRHPHLAALGYPQLPGDDAQLLGALLQVLPMDESSRYPLLETFLQDEFISRLDRWLHEQGLA
ncbi:MAG: ATP-dependent protease [Gammaproteobacteria bacterium]|nr:MAG: ATP-dependent protease [Gammaproteobacteria bacterium]